MNTKSAPFISVSCFLIVKTVLLLILMCLFNPIRILNKFRLKIIFAIQGEACPFLHYPVWLLPRLRAVYQQRTVTLPWLSLTVPSVQPPLVEAYKGERLLYYLLHNPPYFLGFNLFCALTYVFLCVHVLPKCVWRRPRSCCTSNSARTTQHATGFCRWSF